ncbi:ATP-dependent DNA helicase PcrA [Porphyridium purpureum]|uniref:DNA 3'-5' helicase n=1 Tax=Porphyridium purpureum TaxID=35688 RepID=A0A5J4YP63_PORPP|nr:ATP-dependent DNA helicase PcrA [Porphyridium purpureum]|eukprot:POR0811..scf295_9
MPASSSKGLRCIAWIPCAIAHGVLAAAGSGQIRSKSFAATSVRVHARTVVAAFRRGRHQGVFNARQKDEGSSPQKKQPVHQDGSRTARADDEPEKKRQDNAQAWYDIKAAKELSSTLNEVQQNAMMAPLRPILVSAGPGSGKTRLLIHRIALMIASEIDPASILAVTFTNKAANEMKSRLVNALQPWETTAGPRLTIGTFHSFCLRILRRYGTRVGIGNNFDIVDTEDAKSIIKEITARPGIRERIAARDPKDYLQLISKHKAEMIDMLSQDWSDPSAKLVLEAYEKELRLQNKCDFDDLLMFTKRLLKNDVFAREDLSKQYAHILVDEWQDTNSIQYEIIVLLCGSTKSQVRAKSIFVVSDIDQSIYAFRGAMPENVMRFSETDFRGCDVYKLVKNYRSTATIVTASKLLISENKNELRGDFESLKGNGNKVRVGKFPSDYAEASFLCEEAIRLHAKGIPWSEMAVIYRTNIQSRVFEQEMLSSGIPHHVVGGFRFYSRKEVRDVLAYLKVMVNREDRTAFYRVVNVPPRGVGPVAVKKLQELSLELDRSPLSVIDLLATNDPALDRAFTRNAARGLLEFKCIIDESVDFAFKNELGPTLSFLVDKSGYSQFTANQDASAKSDQKQSGEGMKMDVVGEFISAAGAFNSSAVALGTHVLGSRPGRGAEDRATDSVDSEQGSIKAASVIERGSEDEPIVGNATSLETSLSPLAGFIEECTLLDVDAEAFRDGITLTTAHRSKGLEFDVVFVTGCTDSHFPMLFGLEPREEEEKVEDERRLLYVAMTRTRERLYMFYFESHFRFGRKIPCLQSRFLQFLMQAPKSRDLFAPGPGFRSRL